MMRTQLAKAAISLAATLAGLAAVAQPTLQITDGVTNTGPITGASGSVTYVNATFGDNWSVVITTGSSKPVFGSATSPNLELSIQATCTQPGADLVIAFSDTGFGPDSGYFAALLDGQATTGAGAPVTFSSYYDSNNVVLAQTTLLSSAGPLPGPIYHNLTQAGTISANPFSLTEVVVISGATTAKYSLEANLQSLSLDCAGGTGQVGTPYTDYLVATGGCTPYTNFIITSGSLPPGLSLNPATGEITGTPTAPGTFPYVAQVTDCAGRTADTTNESCAIIIGCTGQIGDFVWNDLNGNGCQDAGEPGIPGVEVDLYAGCGGSGTPIATTMTDATGHYLFSGLCPGQYTVGFNTPAGYTRTIAHAGCVNNANPPYSNQTDSKCDCPAGTPCGVCVTLDSANPVNLNVDCGYVCNGQIGDFAWNDLNGNGCQDAGEPGIPGVQVDLYAGCGVTGTPVASTTTDGTGHYLFSGLCPGVYTVSFNTPAGYFRTVANAGCTLRSGPPYSNQTDSKCTCAPGTPCGVCVTLTGANPVNLNVDCGYVAPPTADCVTITAVQDMPITPVTMVGSGGCGGPYTFTATGLPPNLVMSSAGTISGAPTTNGTFTYTVTVKDNCGNTGTINCSVTVGPPPGQPLASGDTATIGFWHNKNGQALILSFNGGKNSTACGTWFATNYGCLFGNLYGKANTVVAAQFLTYFKVTGQKTYAQIMAGALAAYATSSSLGGGNTAAGYGFNVSATGTGAKTFNVGSNGTAIGLSNNTSYTVAQLLAAANANCNGGQLSPAAFNALNNIFDGINSGGDIN